MPREGPAVLVASDQEALADELIRYIEEFPHWRAAAAPDFERLRNALDSDPPDIVLLSEGMVLEAAAKTLQFGRSRPVLVGRELGADALRAAISIGAKDTLIWPKERQRLPAMVKRATSAPRRRGGRGTLVAVWAPKGGSGTSILAAHLCGALGSAGVATLLVDLDLDHADQTAIGGFEDESKTVLDLIRVVDEIDSSLIDGVARMHPAGFRAVLAPGSPGESGLVKSADVTTLLAALRESSEVVVCDLPGGMGELSFSVAVEANALCMVVTPDILSLRRCRDAARVLGAAGFDRRNLRVILNRWPGPTVGPRDVEAVLGTAPFATVRYEPKIEQAADRGELSQAGIRRLQPAARRLSGRVEPKRRGLMRRPR